MTDVSREDIDSLRQFLTVNERGVKAATAEFEHLLHPDFGIDEAADVPDAENYTGREAFIENLEKLEDAFDELRIDPVEFVDLGDHLVVVVVMSGRGRGSGAPVNMTFAQLWSIQDGKAVSLRDFQTKTEAIQAAE